MLIRVAADIQKIAIPFPFGMREVNSYVFQGQHGLTIVDTGSYAPQAIQMWEQTLPAGTRVEKVVLTHAHTDHIGLAKWFQETYQAPVIIARRGYEEMCKYRDRYLHFTGDDTTLHAFFLAHGGPAVSEKAMLKQLADDFFEPDELLEDGQEIRLGDTVFTSIWTPGHSSDHFCFYDRTNRILLAGDLILDGISPLIPVWSEEEGNPLKDYFDSLDRIASLPVDLTLAGHGKEIVDTNTRIFEIKSGHEQRMQQTLEAITAEGSTAGQIAQTVYGLSEMKFRHTAEFVTTLSRLIYLESLGKVRSEVRDGLVFFTTQKDI